MMKSFFKKLAFVMALAMVVSMVAPAGSALAAEAGVSLQGTKTIVKTYELEKVGDTVDFSFQGAKNPEYKTTSKWTSSNEAVATVDKNGVVTAVAAGTATITITSHADGSYVQTVEVTVKEEVKASNFTVKQTSTDTFVLTFGSADEAKKVTAETLTATMLIGDVEMTTPIKSLSADKADVKVVLFGDVTDGFTYRFEYDKNVVEVEASIGDIAYAAYTYYTDKAGDGKAFVSTDEEEAIVKLAYTLYDENGVNVTSRYKDVDAVFELAAENDSVDLDSEGEVIFEKAGAYVINLTVAWEDAEGDEQQTPVYTGVVLAENRPALTLTYAKAGLINAADYEPVEDAKTNFLTKKGPFWKNNLVKDSWIYGDADSEVVFAGLFKDNRGNDVVTGNTKYEYGYFTFGTSNEDVLTVEDDGTLNVYEPGTATVLIYFTNTTGEEDVTTLVGTKRLTVNPKRVPTSYTLDKKNVTIGNAGDTQTGYFEVVVYDQYGGKIALENEAADIVIEATDDENLVTLSAVPADDNGRVYRISFDGSKYTFKKDETYDTFSYNFEMDPDKENPTLKRGSAKLKIKVYDVADAVASVKALEDDKYYYNNSANTGGNVDLYVNFTNDYVKDWYANAVEKFQTTWWQESAVWVNYENSKGLTLAGVPKEKIVPLTKDQKTGEAGYIYYEVTAPEGAVKGTNWDYNVENGKIDLTFNKTGELVWSSRVDDDGNEQWYVSEVKKAGSVKYNEVEYDQPFVYAKTGSYKVKLMYVKNTSTDKDGIGKLSELETYTYTVTNSQPEVKFSDYNADLGNKTTREYADEDGNINETEVLAILDENFEFTFDGKTDNIEDFDNVEVEDVIYELRGENLRITSMLVKVELETTPWDNCKDQLYIYQTVKVNKTIKPAK